MGLCLLGHCGHVLVRSLWACVVTNVRSLWIVLVRSLWACVVRTLWACVG